MKFNFHFPLQRTLNPASRLPKKRFAPWETLFDEMFELWFNVDFPTRRPAINTVAGSEQ